MPAVRKSVVGSFQMSNRSVDQIPQQPACIPQLAISCPVDFGVEGEAMRQNCRVPSGSHRLGLCLIGCSGCRTRFEPQLHLDDSKPKSQGIRSVLDDHQPHYAFAAASGVGQREIGTVRSRQARGQIWPPPKTSATFSRSAVCLPRRVRQQPATISLR